MIINATEYLRFTRTACGRIADYAAIAGDKIQIAPGFQSNLLDFMVAQTPKQFDQSRLESLNPYLTSK